jgi:hypothetical protein
MTCGYTTKTNGLLGNIYDTSLADAYKRKYTFESVHYKKFGNHPCLIRNIHFDEYLEEINTNR